MDMSEKKAGVFRIKRYGIPLLIILLGLLLSLTTFILARVWDLQRIQTEFNQEANDYYETLKREIGSDLQTLLSLQTFYFYSHKVERSDFKDFVKPILSRYPGIQALEWIPRVPNSQRETYEKAARRDGFPGFQITDREAQGKMVRSPHREEYFPVYFVEPYKGNKAALGFDLASDQKRREVLERSRDTREMVASGRIRLVQETAGQFGFLVFAPIYRKDAPADSVESRRQNLEGFTLAVFRIGDITEKSLSYLIPRGIDVSLYDETAPMEERFLYLHRSRLSAVATTSETDKGAKSETRIQYAKGIDVAGRKWMVLCTPFPGYIASRRSWQPWEVLFGGLLFTVLLGSYLVINVNRTERIERLVKERTVELRKINEILEQEIAARTQAEEELQKANDELEDRVKERTQELSIANEQLQCEIIERKQVEEVLKDSEERYRTAIEYSNDGVALMKGDFHLYVNQKFLEMFGYNHSEEIIGKPLSGTVHPDDRDRVMAINLKRQKGEDVPSKYELKGIRKNGDIIYVEVSATKTTYRGETVSLAYMRDITERKQAEEALRWSEETARALLNATTDSVFLIDGSRTVLALNEMAAKRLNTTVDKVLGGCLYDFLPPDLAKRRKTRFDGVFRTGKPAYFEDERQGIWFDNCVYPISDVNGKVMKIAIYGRDITQQKRAEEALRKSEEKYRTILKNIEEGYYEVDLAGNFTFLNDSMSQIFGYPKDELLGMNDRQYTDKENAKGLFQAFNRVCRTGKSHIGYGYEIIRKDGTKRYIEASILLQKDSSDKPIGFRGIIRDITERKQAEEALRESEERSRSLIETSPDVIALIDFSGKIIVINEVALTTYGYESRDEVIGRSVSDFVIPEDRPRVLQEISKVLEVKTLRNLEYSSLKKDGSTFSIEVSASLILDAQQKPTSIVIMIRDITERKHRTAELVNLNKQLEVAKEAAEAGSRAKGEFLASMSHEIRTPLNAVIGMLGLLSTSELSGPHRQYVEIAHSSADGLLVIINDILDFSKIEASKLLFEPVPFDLLRVVEETIDMMVMKTREKGLDLTVQYGPDVPRHFIGDSGRIRQVLINLVNNAIKFTHKGHVLIDVRAEEPMNEEVLLRITVEDTGIGISSDTLDALFKPFVQADASTTRRYGGAGLGLAISKQLVEMMGGTIGASSRSGEGSAFWFTLRLPLDKEFSGVAVPMAEKIALHPPAESGATQTALPKTARWGSPLRVLVVEDNVVNQRVTLLMLTELGCHVDLAANGREAVEMIELLPFDMVFMDWEMPEMDGFEATREIRRLQGDKHLPIIAMTAYALQGDRERCLAAGMDDYFSKPVKLEDFQAALDRWGPKDSRSFEGRLKPPASLEKAPLTVENETSSVIDPNVIARLRGLADATDPSLLMQIFHLFLSDTPERITALREAAATGDTAGLSKAAHSLRGACASIGVMGMVEICKTLESLGHGKYVDGAMALVEKLETEFNQVKVEIEREIAPSPPPSPLGGEKKGEGYSVKDRGIEENDQNEDSHFGR